MIKIIMSSTIMDIYQSNPGVGSGSVWPVVWGCQRYSSERRPGQPWACCDHRGRCGGRTPGETPARQSEWEVAGDDGLTGGVSWLTSAGLECREDSQPWRILQFTHNLGWEHLEIMDLCLFLEAYDWWKCWKLLEDRRLEDTWVE